MTLITLAIIWVGLHFTNRAISGLRDRIQYLENRVSDLTALKAEGEG
jgi:hypothetical protein